MYNLVAKALVTASAKLIKQNWQPEPPPTWVTAIPSHRRPHLVADFAKELAEILQIPFVPALVRKISAPEQKTMANSFMQARNVKHSLDVISDRVQQGPVLLVDDIVDSRWTFTIAGWLLKTAGCSLVYTFALACATPRNR